MGFFSDLGKSLLDPGGIFHNSKNPVQKDQERQAEQTLAQSKEAQDLKRLQFDQLREDAGPLRGLRNENINRLLRMQGINQVPGQAAQPGLMEMQTIRTPFGDIQIPVQGQGTPATEDRIEFGPGDLSGFSTSPEFETVRDAALRVQGTNPNMQQALNERATQLGMGEFGNYHNRIFNTAGFSSSGLANTNRLLQDNIDSQVNLLNNAGAQAAGNLIAGANQRGQAAGSVVGLIGSLFCDARLKKNARKVGEYHSGLGKYEWEWTEKAKELVGNQPPAGPMAHEVFEQMPENVTTRDGYLAIKDMRLVHGY